MPLVRQVAAPCNGVPGQVRCVCFVCLYLHNSLYSWICKYACPVWHPGLTKKLSKDIECVQKRCLKLLFPALSYTESLRKSGLERLDDRRDMITQTRKACLDKLKT